MHLTIKQKIFLSIYGLIFSLTLLIFGLVGITYKRDIESKILSFGTQAVDEMALNLSKNLLNTEENITYKINSTNLFSERTTGGAFTVNSREIKEFVALVGNLGMKVQSCYVKRMDGSEEFWSGGLEKTAEFRASMAAEYLETEIPGMTQNRGTVIWRSFSDMPDSVYIIKNVVEPDTLRRQALLCLQIDSSYFHYLESNQNLLIVVEDENGGVLYHSSELTPDESDAWGQDGSSFLHISTSISKKNWTLVGLIDRFQALKNLRNLMVTLVAMNLAFLVVSFFVAAYISENMTTNIRGLITNMKKIEEGEPAEWIQAKSHDETSYLVEAFNEMNRQLSDTIDQLIYNQTLKEKAEYNALIAQLNPHFLYNTLASISAMAKLNNQKEIVEAIENLSKLLRVCLSEKNEEIALKKELDYVIQYLLLQNLVNGGRIEWDIDCDPGLDELLVPKLILQPIVENCIAHGFVQIQEAAMIVIVAHTEQERLVLEISDNGNGMEQGYADDILASEEVRKSETDRRHIGIKSIQQRIQYLYGETYGIGITAQPEQGTTVRLILPVIRGE